MRKLAIIFVIAVLVPCLVLAGLAFRSLRSQEIVNEKQRALLYEAAAQAVVKDILEFFAGEQRSFGQSLEGFLGKEDPIKLAQAFDPMVLKIYPRAEVGFAVSLQGGMYSPSLVGRPEARRFRLENELFLTSRETAEVYWNGPKGQINLSELDEAERGKLTKGGTKAVSANTEFRSLIGEKREGIVARFLQDRLKLWIWYRSPREEQIVFGAQIRPERLASGLAKLVKVDGGLREQITLVLLDENSRPVSSSRIGFEPQARPFDSIEIGDYLPHWKVAVFVQPTASTTSGPSVRLLFGLLIAALVLAVGVGGWLVLADVNRELRLARQRTDFVSNVSHELKTPLTSIRMFSELLAEGRVENPAKQREYLQVITSETARLTRLINNVLDFARMERGEKRYKSGPCELNDVVTRTVEGYRPHLESAGFKVELHALPTPLNTQADSDAVAQILLNLISNAEKYSTTRKELCVEVAQQNGRATVRVLDRGRGVPVGLEDKVFEQFYRAHDALSESIQGAGLGLTLARQIARSYEGDLRCEEREGGGAVFILALPLMTDDHSTRR